MLSMKNEYKLNCSYCEFRHGGCTQSEEEILKTYDGIPCGQFQLGSCYSCAIYQDGQEAQDSLCMDVFFPSKCINFKLGKPQV